MKFLCDQCKAKYQIADEKVQGKTLRMKCRKCGHIIEIRASNAHPSSMPAPALGPSVGGTMQIDGLTDDQVQAALAPPRANVAPAPAQPKPAAPMAKGVTAPKAAVAPKPAAAPRPAAGGVTAPKAAVQRPVNLSSTQVTVGTPTKKDTISPNSALAKAFQSSVASTPKNPEPEMPASKAPTDPPAEEWYVAIDDVPVGPIRLTELRAKYGQGAVHGDSLVWREGFEEWRPLQTLTDLHELVREEVSGAFGNPRGSLLPGTPPARGGSAVARQPTPAPKPAVARPAAAPAASSGGGGAVRGNVIPFARQQGAAARRLDETQPALEEDEVTRIAPQISPEEVFGAAKPAPVSGPNAVVSDPFATAPAATNATPFAPPTPMVEAATHPHETTMERHTMLERMRSKGVSKGVVALIAAACILLGVIVAVLLVRRMVVVQEKVVEKQVTVPGSVVYVEVPGQAPIALSAAPADPSSSAAKLAMKAGSVGGTSTKPATSASTPGGSAKLGGLDLGPEGPDTTGPGTGGGKGSGEALDGKQVETVVGTKRVSVRKTCYEPYADKGAASARIVLHINPDGTVSASDLTGSTGDSAIGQCVQRLSKGWRFPSSGAGGTFAVPFIFST